MVEPVTTKTLSDRSKRTNPAHGPSRRATYFGSISLENVRCFGPKQSLDLCEENGKPFRWTVILGENGTGKTTLLQALASTWPETVDLESTRTYLPRGFLSQFTKRSPKVDWQPFYRSEFEHSMGIATTILHGSKLSSRTQSYDQFDLGLVGSTGAKAFDVQNTLVRNTCFGYGATRRMGTSVLSDSKEDDPTASLFSDEAVLRNSEEWLLRLDYTAGKRSKKNIDAYRQLEDVKDVLIDILPDVLDIEFTEPKDSADTPSVQFMTPYGWVSIHQLGLGYRTLAAWMIDFASKMFELYPTSKNPLSEGAVCLIDEIDLHLHPSW